jgi:cytidylate kinase
VRLDGEPERRIQQAREHLEMDERTARESLRQNDAGRVAYVQHYYRTDPASPHLYHLVLDSTRFSPEMCTEIIVSAARKVDRVDKPN